MQKKMKNEKIQGVQAENMEREQETKEFLKQMENGKPCRSMW